MEKLMTPEGGIILLLLLTLLGELWQILGLMQELHDTKQDLREVQEAFQVMYEASLELRREVEGMHL